MMSLPVFILVDADIYGIKIMLTYRFGSAKSCHVADQLAVPNARWLGVFPSEISKYGMQHQKLSNRDKRLTKLLLECPFMEDQTTISRELNVLLESNKKASIEGLIKNNTFLSESYLPMKFFNQDFL
jgi:meiotic recombination protein SPO11